MRIEAMNKVSQLYNTGKTKKIGQTGSMSFADTLEISRTGKDIQVGKNAAMAAPSVREDKVAALKSQIESGDYNVDDEDLVDKLLESFDLPF